jgi:hypothetical protein
MTFAPYCSSRTAASVEDKPVDLPPVLMNSDAAADMADCHARLNEREYLATDLRTFLARGNDITQRVLNAHDRDEATSLHEAELTDLSPLFMLRSRPY